MADISHTHDIPTERDGISYRGIGWFVVILAGTTVVCQILMWALFAVLDRQVTGNDIARAPLAAPIDVPSIQDGRIVPGSEVPAPNLLVSEPVNLRQFRENEEKALSTYGWIDKNAGTVRIPIDRAKELLLGRGLPVRSATPEPPTKPAKAPAKGPGKKPQP